MKVATRAVMITLGLAAAGMLAAFLLPEVLPPDAAPARLFPVLVTLLIAGVTYYAAQFTRIMAHQFKETREGQFRPYLIAELEKRGSQLYLVIRAAGQGAARDVHIRLLTPVTNADGVNLQGLPLFRDILPHLAAQKKLRILLRRGADDEAPLPAQIPVSITYRDHYVSERDFHDHIVLKPHLLDGLEED